MHLTLTSRSLLLATEPAWFPVHSPRARQIPLAVREWLAAPGSLTARLQVFAGPIQVRVLYQGWGRPFLSEALRLKVSSKQRVWIREVALEAAGSRLLLARTLAPPKTLAGPGKKFTRLGARPLGELLFSGLRCKRVRVDWACLDSVCWLGFPAEYPRWGRRTLYLIDRGLPLLVNEFFLPEVFALEARDGLA